MRAIISTIGRFHMFALARELHRRDGLEAIFSGFPWTKLKREKLPRDKVKTFPFIRPFEFAFYRSPLFQMMPGAALPMMQAAAVFQDRYVAARLPDADIFVGHEAVGLVSGRKARARGMRYVCDRGCSHASWRTRLLAEEYDRVGIKAPWKQPATLERELGEYAEADRIVVPSTFAKNSFLTEGIAEEKMWVVPYGADLGHFRRVGVPDPTEIRMLFVGGVAVRKGIHDLLKAFRLVDHPAKRLTIAGGVAPEVADLVAKAAAEDDRITLAGVVPFSDLPALYSNHHALILPSVEEGLALVMAEAMACGTPVIATENTGAPDLYADGTEGFIVPIRRPDLIADRITRFADDPELWACMSAAAANRVRDFGGWSAYGDRTYALYQSLL